jgi:hypothetical protein
MVALPAELPALTTKQNANPSPVVKPGNGTLLTIAALALALKTNTRAAAVRVLGNFTAVSFGWLG